MGGLFFLKREEQKKGVQAAALAKVPHSAYFSYPEGQFWYINESFHSEFMCSCCSPVILKRGDVMLLWRLHVLMIQAELGRPEVHIRMYILTEYNPIGFHY